MKQDERVSVVGTVKTGSSGERYIAATSVTTDTGTFVVKPLALAGRQISGGVAGLQNGTWSWDTVKLPDGTFVKKWVQSTNINTIGLLVGAFGKVTFVRSGFFYMDDGSAVNDLSGKLGVKVKADGLTLPSVGSMVSVTGISSCEKNAEGKLLRLLLPRKQEDIVVH